MNLSEKSGLTLIESLVSMVLIGTLLIGILGAFFISRLGTERAKHRIMAMNVAQKYMERELRAGFLGGYVDGDYYVTFDSSAAKDKNDDPDLDFALGATIRPSPYSAWVWPIYTTSGGSVSFKVIGFIVQWNEQMFQSGATRTCTERIATYVAEHS